jgi:D-alanyl-lipoteichoic acid acyltransferase DltB (MBOAT superfamily)
MALGLGLMFGIRLPLNFNSPYKSSSIIDFWRRWHMSLSSWLRDYLYIPLGGSRRGLPRTIAALAATWLLGGLWHGMAAHFMVWGAYHGLMVSAGRYFETTAIRRRKPLPDWAKIACTFIIVVFGWVLFRTPSLDKAWIIWGRMLSPLGARFWDGVASFGWPVPAFLLLATAAHLLTYRLYGANPDRSLMLEWPYPLRLSTLAVLAIVCLVFSGDSRSFIYFQF